MKLSITACHGETGYLALCIACHICTLLSFLILLYFRFALAKPYVQSFISDVRYLVFWDLYIEHFHSMKLVPPPPLNWLGTVATCSYKDNPEIKVQYEVQYNFIQTDWVCHNI